jgi:hypothetical protein
MINGTLEATPRVEKVTMNGGTLTKWMTAPLTTPSSAPAARARRAAIGQGRPICISSGASTPVIATFAPVERSIPPVSRTKV